MEWSDWIALGSMLIALIALGFSLWGYSVYDRPIKSLQKEQLEREALENKQAKLNVVYTRLLIYNILRIQNEGPATAKNIVVELYDDNALAFEGMKTQYHIVQLEPTEKSKDISIIGNAPYRLKVKLTWDDETGMKQTKNYFLERNE